MLSKYLQQVQRLVGDANQVSMNPADLVWCINEGRKQVAMQSGCVRWTPPGMVTTQGQEVYNFADVDLSAYPGAESIYAIRGISLIWGNYRYTLDRVSWSKYQARVRNYATGWEDVPSIAAQFGQGVNGSIYIYPVPSEAYVMEWDCSLLPVDLVDDSTPEVIPAPWDNPVWLYAASQAMTMKAAQTPNIQQAQVYIAMSDRFMKQFDRYMARSRAFVQPGYVSSWYGRRV